MCCTFVGAEILMGVMSLSHAGCVGINNFVSQTLNVKIIDTKCSSVTLIKVFHTLFFATSIACCFHMY